MRSVVICGSRRFERDIRQFGKSLEKMGVVVYEPILNRDVKINSLPDHFKRFAFLGLTHHQFSYIRKADVVYIYNKGGYMGVSTTLELGFAEALSKPIYAYNVDNSELSRDGLFDEIVKTPKKLVKLLK